MFGLRKKKARPHFVGDLGQDAWVARVFAGQRGGYFLDFGAFDGKDMSNTLYLERELGWRGICVEPNPTYYPTLCAERTAICVNSALWSRSREVLTMVDAHGLSSFEHLKDGDSNARVRTQATQRVIEVETVSPTDLLDRFGAPSGIEYMSLDVEGSEYDILTGIDFSRYTIKLMTIEHDCSPERQAKVREYLGRFGYVGLQMGYDDFFYRTDIAYPVPPDQVARAMGCLEA
ncbi:FkbM family methyltransferase [Methylobacterium sp. sgz302541]|uniref:FkbM family methyltransferase n=1 Tax=unclassified Methylobacterium TaxID=2615210 RepID=UPI003D334498